MDTRVRQVIFVLLCSVFSQAVSAAEISAFKLTEFDGELAFRYLYDEQSISEADVEIQKNTRPSYQQELTVNTRSYVYHPYLLNMDISGGVVLDQSQYESLGVESRTEEELLNLNARFNFLEKKPYPVTLYYNQQNPTVSTGVAEHFIQENIRYGIDAALMEPVSPVLISIKAFHQTSTGEGFDQVVNDDEKQAILRIYTAYSSQAHIELTHQENRLVSSSGSTSPDLQITERESDRQQTTFDSRNVFGRQNQIQFTTSASSNVQNQYPVRNEQTLTPAVNWKHSDNMDTYYRMYFLDSTEEMLDTELKRIDTGISYHTESFNNNLSFQAEDNQSTNIDSTLAGLKYNYGYKKKLSHSELQFNFNSLYEERDQAASLEIASVYGESHVLSSLNAVTLNRENIIQNSLIYPIEVSNQNRTQTYTEGLDYRVITVAEEIVNISGENLTVALQTQIQRLVGGNINDGQTVLVDYRYNTGGTFAYNRANSNLNINWAILSSYNIYLRLQDSDVNLEEGTPSIRLNPMTGYTYGASMDKPLISGIIVGAEIYQESRDEEVNPYIKDSVDAFIELPLPNLTNVRLSARQIKQDNELSEEDIDMQSMTLRIQSRPWLRGSMSIESMYEDDVGGTIERRVEQHRLRFNWNIRQLSLVASVNFGKEQQAEIIRERWEARLSASRHF
ncbi:MAG: hypothetical protein OEY36_06895 [Gammaproteobacteria bacterium]|nr:hypothetical protein [Gammaproteobacteria bacterium]